MRSLVGPDPCALDVDAQAHADVIAFRSGAEKFQCFLEQQRVVAAVVDDRVAVLPGHADVVRELIRLDEVAAPHLGTIDAQLGRDGVERALHHEARMRPAGSSIRGRGSGIRVDVAEPDAIVGQPVRTRELPRGDDRQDDPVRRVGAAVVDEVVAQGQQAALGVVSDLDLVHLPALLVDGGEMLLPVLGPLHRPPELHRGVGHEQLVRVEEHDLRPEPAAHVRRDDLDVRLRQSEQDRQPATNRCRRLRGVEHGELALRCRPSGPDRPALQRAGGGALKPKVEPLSVRGGFERRIHVADLLKHLGSDVAGNVRVHQVLGRGCRLGRDDDGERFVLDLHRLGCILGQGPGLGDDERHRLTGVADDVGGQGALGAAVGEVRMRDEDGQVLVAER